MSEDGLVIVSECSGHCITILNKKGEKIRSFGSKGTGKGEFKEPRGVAVTDRGTILVVDCCNNRIQQFTMEGQCISCVGKRGKGPLEFSYPSGIAVNKITGQVFVADFGNHRIQVLNPDLSFSHSFGNRGSKEGQFNFPYDVSVNDVGTVYVANTDNNRIQFFTPEGMFLSMFVINRVRPWGLAYLEHILYITHSGYSGITMYTTSGECIGTIEGATVSPIHLAVDGAGYLYCCAKDCVVIL